MSDVTSISVLRAFAPAYRMLTVYNLDNFRNANWRTILRNLVWATLTTILLGSSFIVAMVNVCYCYENKFQLRIIAMPIASYINTEQVTITYISMRMKLEQVDRVTASLNETINQRTSTNQFQLFLKMFFWHIFQFEHGLLSFSSKDVDGRANHMPSSTVWKGASH